MCEDFPEPCRKRKRLFKQTARGRQQAKPWNTSPAAAGRRQAPGVSRQHQVLTRKIKGRVSLYIAHESPLRVLQTHDLGRQAELTACSCDLNVLRKIMYWWGNFLTLIFVHWNKPQTRCSVCHQCRPVDAYISAPKRPAYNKAASTSVNIYIH